MPGVNGTSKEGGSTGRAILLTIVLAEHYPPGGYTGAFFWQHGRFITLFFGV
jgi:hypothetical protein